MWYPIFLTGTTGTGTLFQSSDFVILLYQANLTVDPKATFFPPKPSVLGCFSYNAGASCLRAL